MTRERGTTLLATYRIVTPMFCAGADQNSAELRLASFKGALRFWWRSLMWGNVSGVEELRRREAELFGASDQKTGQSKVHMRLQNVELEPVISPPSVFENGQLHGAHYLGYGVMEAFESKTKGTKAGQLTRAMIPGGSFTVAMRCSTEVNHEEVEQIRQACVLLGTVGGLGSKARKGYGSLTLTKMVVNDKVISVPPDVDNRLLSIFPRLSTGNDLPEWTAWSHRARVVKATSSNSLRAVQLLDLVGREQVHFRSWGRNGKVLRQDSERNFPFDHRLSKGKNEVASYPHRTAFGLPHNYGKGKHLAVEPVNYDRRASALFIHVDQFSDQSQPQALLAFIPSRFLPDNEQVSAFDRHVPLRTDGAFWYPVHAFLDRLLTKGTQPDARPGYEDFPQDSLWWHKKTALQGQEVKLG